MNYMCYLECMCFHRAVFSEKYPCKRAKALLSEVHERNPLSNCRFFISKGLAPDSLLSVLDLPSPRRAPVSVPLPLMPPRVLGSLNEMVGSIFIEHRIDEI